MIKVTVISENVNVSKDCKTEKQAYRFEQDMAAKYGLLFSSIPYYVKRIML